MCWKVKVLKVKLSCDQAYIYVKWVNEELQLKPISIASWAILDSQGLKSDCEITVKNDESSTGQLMFDIEAWEKSHAESQEVAPKKPPRQKRGGFFSFLRS